MSDSSKGNLLTGLVVGVIIAAIGFFALSNTFNKDTSDTANTKGEEETQEQVNNNDNSGSPTTDTEITSSDHIRGNVNASITIVEYSDFQCPFCQRFHETMQQVLAEYPNDVRWVYKHFPIDSIHPVARKAAEASECAGEQDKFWEYADAVYENQSDLSDSSLSNIAKEIDLNSSDFEDCLDSEKYASKVEADYQEGIKAGVRGTPGSFINGQSVAGAQPFENLKAIIDDLL